jgi:hypothetical protein
MVIGGERGLCRRAPVAKEGDSLTNGCKEGWVELYSSNSNSRSGLTVDSCSRWGRYYILYTQIHDLPTL